MEKLLKLLDDHKDLCEREELLEGRAVKFSWFGPNLSEGNRVAEEKLLKELEQVRISIVAVEWKLEDAIAASIKESEEAVKEAQRVLDEMYPLTEASWPRIKLKNAIRENRHPEWYPVADMEINSESTLTTSEEE